MTSETDSLGLVGTTIADKYAVESVVGSGGFAVVYRALHTLWKRPVAVKVFKALGEVSPDQRQKLLDDFIQEGALLAELSERSSAICQARDVGMLTTTRGEVVPYMVLEWLEGRTLEEVLLDERDRALPLRSLAEATRLLDPVGEALALAHKTGVAHRDVKPANVFVLGDPRGPDLSVKLLDFGIAKVVQDAQKMGFGKTAGHITSFTPYYGAPEQFSRSYGATGPWTDVFALALVIVEVISGREPIEGETLVQLAAASCDPNRRPTPRRLGVELSEAVEAVFVRALAVKPEDRFQSVGDLWGALRTAASGDPRSVLAAPRNRVSGGPAGFVGATYAAAPTAMASGPQLPSSLAPSGPRLPIAAASAPQLEGRGGASIPPASRSRAPIAIAVISLGVLAGAGLGAFALRGGAGGATPPGGLTSASADLTRESGAAAMVSAGAAETCPPGMLSIPGGEFFMGGADAQASSFEKPPHKVSLAPYCLDELEVSVAKYRACSDRGACRRAGKENVENGITPVQRKIYDPLCNARDPDGKRDHPINCVDWVQAKEYCEAQGARLPTEAEWEFAARGPDGRVYPWGDDPPGAQLLNACGAECLAWQKTHVDPDGPPAAMYGEDDGHEATAPVGSFPKGKSRYGAQDMVGNVWEWVADWYAPYGEASANQTMADPRGPDAGTERVLRGGGWNSAQAAWVRPTFRYRAPPATRSHGFGFRCAKSR